MRYWALRLRWWKGRVGETLVSDRTLAVGADLDMMLVVSVG